MTTTTVTEFDAFVVDVAGLHDEIGVLSVYVGVDPREEARARPPWAIAIDGDLHALRAKLRTDGRHEEWSALDLRLHELAPLLEQMMDPAEHGRGRALFATVRSDEVRTISLQARLPISASLGEVAHLAPLLAADEGCPVGMVIVGRNEVRTLETRLGSLAELDGFDVEPLVFDGPERKGPAAYNPARGQQTVAQRERYERHVEDVHRRRLGSVATAVSQLGAERGWELALVAGDPRGGRPLAAALDGAGIETQLVDRTLEALTGPQALDELAPAAAALRRRRDLALVRRIRDAALSGGRGAVGPADVLAALEEGRVAELVLDATRPVVGVVTPDGRLFPAGVDVPELPRDELRPDARLADRMAIKALAADARVRVVHGDAAELLADSDGVAALLRW